MWFVRAKTIKWAFFQMNEQNSIDHLRPFSPELYSSTNNHRKNTSTKTFITIKCKNKREKIIISLPRAHHIVCVCVFLRAFSENETAFTHRSLSNLRIRNNTHSFYTTHIIYSMSIDVECSTINFLRALPCLLIHHKQV